MLLVSLCVPVITCLCNRAMRFQSRPTKLTLAHHRVSSWLEHPTRSRRVVGSNPIWTRIFFRVFLSLSCCCCFILNLIYFTKLFGLQPTCKLVPKTFPLRVRRPGKGKRAGNEQVAAHVDLSTRNKNDFCFWSHAPSCSQS